MRQQGHGSRAEDVLSLTSRSNLRQLAADRSALTEDARQDPQALPSGCTQQGRGDSPQKALTAATPSDIPLSYCNRLNGRQPRSDCDRHAYSIVIVIGIWYNRHRINNYSDDTQKGETQ